jgi:site-specific DNA-methyltransferase (adenine-specific)
VTETTWETPQPFFDMLDAEFGFTVDVCAWNHNAKLERYFSPLEDGLKQDWSREVFWMNPPYGRGQDVYSWVRKAYESALAGGTGVALLPVSADTKWYHEFVMRSTEIRFVRDRLWFRLDGKEARANHASMAVVFGRVLGQEPRTFSISNCRQPKRIAA